jgi:glycosyltransferase involved in cell wall biosynthesis
VRISILTPSYNQAAFVEETIRSVLAQEGIDLEHIVMDGGSADGTVEILHRFPHLVWVSEKDGGQADALNKALARATGQIIGWLNSDDLYTPGALAEVVESFRDPATQWVIGNLTTWYESTDSRVTNRSPAMTRAALLADPDILRQQPTFFRRELLERAGGWNAGYHMTMDYDLWVRLLRLAEPLMVDRVWAVFRIHPAQKTSRRNLGIQLAELTEIMRREGAGEPAIRRLRRKRAVLMTKVAVKEALIASGLLSERYAARPLRLPRSAGG